MRRLGRVIITLLLLSGMAGFSHAQLLPFQQDQSQLNRNNQAQDIRNAAQADGRITELQAGNLARQRFPGNILRITLVGEGDNQRWQIRMENEGKVFTVFVHVTTGRVTGGT